MARYLEQSNIERILYGATFLGGGGGGPLDTAIEILQQYAKEHKVAIELLGLDEIDRNDYGAMVACLGSPEAMKIGTFGPDGVAAFEAFQMALKLENKQVAYLYSGEMGGFNTFAPMLVALYSGEDPEKRIKFLDVDANGRAVPELNTSLNAARGFPPYPVGMGSLYGNKVVAYGISDSESEAIARALCAIYNNQIGFATWAMNQMELRENAVVGCVTFAEQVGERIEQAKRDGGEPAEYLSKIMPCRLYSKAQIVEKRTEVIQGFDCGTTTLKDVTTGNILNVHFQNENLVMVHGDNTGIITAPEIISMICRDHDQNAYLPLNNASTREGMLVDVILAPADQKWWDEKEAYKVWRPCLTRVGYDGPQIRFEDVK